MTAIEAGYMSEVLKAYSEGKVIQWSWKMLNAWNDIEKSEWNFETNLDKIEYRIKPEPKYRLYSNSEEFLNAQKEHGPYIKEIGPQNVRYLNPIMVFDDHVIFWFSNGGIDYKYSDLIHKKYCWQDGTLCGILEK